MEKQKLFFESQTARVYYDYELDTLFLEYLKNVKNHAEFLMINEALLNAFLQLTTTKFVADIRKMGIIGIESQEYVAEVLLPTMIKHLQGAPFFHMQLLDEKDVFSKISGSGVKSRAEKKEEHGVTVEQFTDRDKMIERLKVISKLPQ